MFHELGHYLILRKNGYNPNQLFFTLAGIRISINETIDCDDEFEIAFAGPFVNIFLAITCVAFWWIVPDSYFYTKTFCICNIFLASFNLLPVEPLDGSRILNSILSKYSAKKIRIIKIIINILLILLSLTLFIISCFSSPNYFWLLLTIFFLANITQNIPKAISEKVLFFKKNKINKPKNIKFIYLPHDANLLTAFNMISKRYYTVFLHNSRLYSQDWILSKLKLLPSLTKLKDT